MKGKTEKAGAHGHENIKKPVGYENDHMQIHAKPNQQGPHQPELHWAPRDHFPYNHISESWEPRP